MFKVGYEAELYAVIHLPDRWRHSFDKNWGNYYKVEGHQSSLFSYSTYYQWSSRQVGMVSLLICHRLLRQMCIHPYLVHSERIERIICETDMMLMWYLRLLGEVDRKQINNKSEMLLTDLFIRYQVGDENTNRNTVILTDKFTHEPLCLYMIVHIIKVVLTECLDKLKQRLLNTNEKLIIRQSESRFIQVENNLVEMLQSCCIIRQNVHFTSFSACYNIDNRKSYEQWCYRNEIYAEYRKNKNFTANGMPRCKYYI